MNDDKKFQERAEIVKQLLLARIPIDVVAKVAGVSEATVENDRIRFTKLYGIKIPRVASTAFEREERFRILFKAYLTVIFKTNERKDPIYQAAKLLIDFERIEDHIDSLRRLFDGLQRPRFSSDDLISKGYQQLIEDCFDDGHEHFEINFYEAIYSGIIPYENFGNENDLIELAKKFYFDKNRSCINTLVIDDPKIVVGSVFADLTEVHVTALKEKYGLDSPRKTLVESGKVHGLSCGRIRQIRQNALCLFRSELFKKMYLIHSTAKYERFEKQYADLNEKYSSYCKDTDQMIFNLGVEIAKLDGVLENAFDESFDYCGYSNIAFLVKPVSELHYELPRRIINCLQCGNYVYVLDIIENWEDLIEIRCFGRKCYMVLDECFLSHGVDRSKITEEEKASAKRLIKKIK